MRARKREGEAQYGDRRAEPDEPIAPSGIKRLPVRIAEGQNFSQLAPGRLFCDDSSGWIDGRGDAVVRYADDPAGVLRGAHADDLQVLVACGGFTEPAV